MTIQIKLSTKAQKESGKHEILLRLIHDKINLRCKTSIYIDPKYFEYYIDRAKTEKAGTHLSTSAMTSTKENAEKEGYILRDSGTVVIKARLASPQVREARQAQDMLEKLKKLIEESFYATGRQNVSPEWIKRIVDKFHNRDTTRQTAPTAIYGLMEEYIEKKQFPYNNVKAYHVLMRDIARYELFIRHTEDPKFTFDVHTISREVIEDFIDYLRNEKRLADENPALYARILRDFPAGMGRNNKLEERGDNTIIKLSKKLKAFLVWLHDMGRTTNRPFDGIRIPAEKFGTPYYITIEERNHIAAFDFSFSRHLEVQRDIFVFQCLIGCRVSDLMKLTEGNICGGILTYTPHKTKDEGQHAAQARVPLHEQAVRLIDKYRGTDRHGRLFPFISTQKYNDAIKEIFTRAGITREVEVRNSITGEIELRHINEIASSHLARRTFVGNAYLRVSDPNIIGKMSGHSEGSRAFTRYRNIEDTTLRNIIDQL